MRKTIIIFFILPISILGQIKKNHTIDEKWERVTYNKSDSLEIKINKFLKSKNITPKKYNIIKYKLECFDKCDYLMEYHVKKSNDYSVVYRVLRNKEGYSHLLTNKIERFKSLTNQLGLNIKSEKGALDFLKLFTNSIFLEKGKFILVHGKKHLLSLIPNPVFLKIIDYNKYKPIVKYKDGLYNINTLAIYNNNLMLLKFTVSKDGNVKLKNDLIIYKNIPSFSEKFIDYAFVLKKEDIYSQFEKDISTTMRNLKFTKKVDFSEFDNKEFLTNIYNGEFDKINDRRRGAYIRPDLFVNFIEYFSRKCSKISKNLTPFKTNELTIKSNDILYVNTYYLGILNREEFMAKSNSKSGVLNLVNKASFEEDFKKFNNLFSCNSRERKQFELNLLLLIYGQESLQNSIREH